MPLNYFFVFTSIFLWWPEILTKNDISFLLVIDPAGSPGRKLSDSFERGATLQCAEMLKKTIEKSSSDIEVIITRTVGSNTSQEQSAQMANRLKADLYIHLSFFQESEVKPRLFLYTCSYANDFPIKQTPFLFCPYDHAHCLSLETTTLYAHQLQQTLLASPYSVFAPIATAYSPLKGITVPAIGIEIGLHSTRDWRECVSVLCNSFETIFKKTIL